MFIYINSGNAQSLWSLLNYQVIQITPISNEEFIS